MITRTVTFAFALLCAPIAAFPQATHSQSRENCEAFAPLLEQTSDVLALLWQEMGEVDFAYAGARVGGDAGRQLADLGRRVRDVSPEMNEFIQAFQDTAISLRACAG